MNLLLSAIIGLSVSTWLYTKLRKGAIDAKQPLIACVALFVFITIICFILANMFIPE